MAGDIRSAPQQARVRGHGGATLAGDRVQVVCPRCRGVLGIASSGELACAGCGTRHPVVDGIPVLSDLAQHDPGTSHKRRQIEFFDAEAAEFEIMRPHGQPRLYRWLMAEKFRRSVRGVEPRLAGSTILTVCGGSGMDAEFLARRGAVVVTSDLSLGAVQRAVERGRRLGFEIDGVVADAERLPFADRSIDIVCVHDGLHHLLDPMLGLSEMCRVARDSVLVTEPTRAAVTSIAVRLGIALEQEDAGNRVQRVAGDELVAFLHGRDFVVVGAERYAMYYRHKPAWGMRLFSYPLSYRLATVAMISFNTILGRVGNKLAVRAVRDLPAARS